MAESSAETAAAPPAPSSDGSTEITFKTISQQTFKYTFPLSTTVGDIKKKLYEDKGEDFEVDRQKLIYNGKVLEDAQTLADINVDEKKYVVVMVSRKKTEQPVAPPQQSSSTTAAPETTSAPAAAPATTTAPVAPTTAAATATTTTPSVATPAAPVPPTNTVPPEYEETIENIVAMGYPREQVIPALRAAFFNADRAVEYLLSGIPANVGQNPEGAVPMEALEQGLEGEEEEGEENPLAFLRDSPQFAQICQLVRAQPDMLPQILQQIAQTNPDLMNVIRDHQEEFVQMLNENVGEEQQQQGAEGGAGAPPPHQSGHLTIAVSEDDRNAIQRLESMGFPQQLVIEAYFACDKNEDLAVNYILSRLEEVSSETD